MTKIGFIGFGSMATLIATKMLKAKVTSPEEIIIYSSSENEHLKNFYDQYPTSELAANEAEVFTKAEHSFICKLPLAVLPLIKDCSSVLTSERHVISIAASISTKDILDIVPNLQISKLIPSLTTAVGIGTTLIVHSDQVMSYNRQWLETAFDSFGHVMTIREENMEIASDLTSSSPGIIAAIFEQFMEAALRRSSLSDAEVFQMINFSLAGTSKLLVEEDYTFSGLIERVATKGGITAEGVELSQKQLPAFFDELLNRTQDKYSQSKLEIEKQKKDLLS
ncbi:pyrroline-5-carboxylate reductase ProG [Listeria ivanovii]|uniref:pyrroline-5-carboxylate reductase ProG n=1 Tax=Listeria ivanovii TaxID=1638 RepID=UPI00051271A2|nr:pyrroline-5-carboxylate reductase ProG [Listeria ivanovii]AIS62613.1 pyrroline-5-carboxylate reductase [Listeria ivanovii subsp. londoniensis]MBK1964917.1 pyrroline-5-carboxylate reductase [Listeria ivanovii subsp. londoniensis]MBK1984438.1 pyrroline-5-carboxylate reductase [Listeria ivanovii subsp. londoniensis]MBK1995800.1 pyrroline-5-carboxylate reductase [Listeria ivanovii subsp. londoniensis]MBM5720604.1 pyrroline-5-carboxylate reductase [Listeria ivanovii]